MAKTPKQVADAIKQAQKRIAKATQPNGKIAVTYKPGVERVKKPTKVQKPDDEGLSINEIIKETTARTRQLKRRDNVSIRQFKKSRSGANIMCETVSYKQNGENTYYKQIIENLDDDTDLFSKSKWIVVSCTCPQFKFTHDWTLHQAGSSNLEFSTDEASNIRNPRQFHGGCKHLLTVLTKIKTDRI